MKKLLTIFSTLFISAAIFAVTEEEAREYFQNCISNLDPIEGCYSVEYRGHGETIFGSAWTEFAETSLHPDVYIIKMNENRDGKYLVCIGNTANQDWQYYWVLERIGTTNTYKFLVFDKNNVVVQSCHTYLEKDLRFVVNFIKTEAGGYTSASNGSTYVGGKSYDFQLSFVKSFPTTEMYQSNKSEQSSMESQYSGGTGFALKDNYFITNYHVYGNRKYALVKGQNNNTYRAYFVGGDEMNDIAIFQIRDNKFEGFKHIPYTISLQTADIGEEAWTIGFPMTNILGEEAKYTKGEINALSGSRMDGDVLKTNDTRLYQISTDITHGNSGGPLFDEVGNIIGITSSGWSANTFNSVNYALKSQFIYTVLESAGLRNVVPTGQLLKGQKRKDQIKLVKPYVFQVITYNDKRIEEQWQQEKEIPKSEIVDSAKLVQNVLKVPCDTLITTNGNQILVHIVNISSSVVRYKEINANNDNIQAIEKSQIHAIVFANGVRQEYNNIYTPNNTATQKSIVVEEGINPMYKQGNTYYYNGKSYSGVEYENFIKERCQVAYNEYIGGKQLAKMGFAFCGAGAGSLLIGGIIYGCTKSVGGMIGGEILMAAGTGAVGGGVVVLGIGLNKKNSAYKTFNKNCHNHYTPDRHINLQICQNSIGVSFCF